MATQKVPEHMQFHSKYWRHFQERSQYFNIEYIHVYAIKIRAIYILTLELSLYIQCLYRPQGLVGQRFNNFVVLGLPGSDMLHLPTGQRVHLHAPSEITPTNPMFFLFPLSFVSFLSVFTQVDTKCHDCAFSRRRFFLRF